VSVEKDLDRLLGDVDLIIPTLEDDAALSSLARWSRNSGVPLAFDSKAYAVSCSKLRSAQFFKEIGVPVPAAWPDCGFPVLAKPGRGSGSRGVRVFRDLAVLKDAFPAKLPPRDWVLEEFIDGSEHSLEVIGRPGDYQTLQVTDLYVDQTFDCKRVIAPSNLSSDSIAAFEQLTLKLAEALDLHGIMDVEIVHSRGEFRVLEIDARLPSQTPTAVYWSTRRNMLESLAGLYVAGMGESPPLEAGVHGAVYEHIHVSGEGLKICGEHIMANAGPLELVEDFFGADEAITNFAPDRQPWVATLIYRGADRREACVKRNRSIAEIVGRFDLGECPPEID